MNEFQMPDLRIEYLRPDELIPYERNARQHTPTDIEQIKTSIERVGFDDPIGIWGDQNIVVEGHGRLIAAKEMGLERVPCIRLDHMTDVQRRRYAIDHNRTQELSGWDFEKLEQEIAALTIAGTDLSGLKFAIQRAVEGEPEKEFLEGEKRHVCPRCGHEWRDDA